MAGRPSTYTPEIAQHILDELSEGKTLTSICAAEGMPTRKCVVTNWCESYPEFGVAYARARQVGYEALADQLRDIANTPKPGKKTVRKPTGNEIHAGDMIEHRKLQVDTGKWFLSKLVPKIYGDKQVIEHQGEIKLTDRLLRARNRAG